MADVTSLSLRPPTVADGAAIWQIAGSGGLDLNSPYSYLLWCRDFPATSVVAERDGSLLGFVTGYRRPEEPRALFVWQVAVSPAARGGGLGGRMLDHLGATVAGIDHLEASVTPDNVASRRMFEGFARRRGAGVHERELFRAEEFPGAAGVHEPEVLLRIGPFGS